MMNQDPNPERRDRERYAQPRRSSYLPSSVKGAICAVGDRGVSKVFGAFVVRDMFCCVFAFNMFSVPRVFNGNTP